MKLNLAVFFGGKSVEHEVSIITGLQAIDALDKEKYEIIPVYITKDNLFYTGTPLFDIAEYRDIPELLHRSIRVGIVNFDGKAQLQYLPPRRFTKPFHTAIDCALLCNHGTTVEDGALQGLLKFNGIPFTGCDVTASAIGMDKYAAKCVVEKVGVPVLSAIRFYSREYMGDPEQAFDRIEKAAEYPIIIKPVNLGSSVGIKIAKNRAELKSAIDNAVMFTDNIMAEHAVTALREVNVSVLGDAVSCEASECEEPISGATGFLSYQDKYMSGRGGKQGSKNGGKLGSKSGAKSGSSGMASLSRKIPADITEEQRHLIRDYARSAFSALGCAGVARLDFILDGDNGEIYFNEINTIPGSLSYYLWSAPSLKQNSMPYSELLDRLVSVALKREREAAAINTSFDVNILANAVIPTGSKT